MRFPNLFLPLLIPEILTCLTRDPQDTILPNIKKFSRKTNQISFGNVDFFVILRNIHAVVDTARRLSATSDAHKKRRPDFSERLG